VSDHGPYRSHLRASWCLAVAVVLGGAGPAAASPGPDQAPQSASQPRGNPDFWFGQPRGSIGVRGSWLIARAGSDVFDFLQDQLTIEDGDFNAPAIGGDVGVALTPRVDALFGIDFSRVSNASEYRRFVDNNRLPIPQETGLTQVNLSGSVKLALSPRGRTISRLAWIPRTVTPYAGGGAGFLWYRFRQHGEFVDFVDLSIFRSTFRSSGWTPSAHLFGGTDVRLWRRMFLGLEARYLWAHAELGRDFSGFDPIDLTGLKLTAGVNVAF